MVLNKRFYTFILVGIVNTIFGYSMYALLLYIHLHYSLAVLLATVLGVLFNFKTTGRLVFKINNNRLILKFVRVYVLTYVLNVAVLRVFNAYHFNLYYAGLIMILPMAALSYILQSKYVFKEIGIHAAD